MQYSNLTSMLFLQVGIILLTCRIVSFIGVKFFNQSTVVCEIIAGILLGPSFLGYFFPYAQTWLFPNSTILSTTGSIIPNPSMSILYAVSQIGIITYMFLIGMEINIKFLKKHHKKAILIAIFGILFPFLLSSVFTLFLTDNQLFNIQVSQNIRILFLGTALSITALPVMARILKETGYIKTDLGTLCLTASAFGDIVTFVMLSMILHASTNKGTDINKTILYSILLIFLIVAFNKLLFLLFKKVKEKKMFISSQSFMLIIALLMLWVWSSEKAGLYSVFGAFLAGLIMPRFHIVTKQLKKNLNKITLAFLLPIFFVFSGLNTKIYLLYDLQAWTVLGIVILIAILGKLFGCIAAAKLMGINWQEASMVGILMNARGLMELIVLNIGLEAGIITHKFFTILVIMAVLTTMMVAPFFNFFVPKLKYITYGYSLLRKRGYVMNQSTESKNLT